MCNVTFASECVDYSLETKKRQADSSKTEPYASRLREERARVEPHQGHFSEKIGVPQKRQSFLENGERELRAEYLDRLAAAGLDIQFIITGKRSPGGMSDAESELLTHFNRLPVAMKVVAVAQLKALADELSRMSGSDWSSLSAPAPEPQSSIHEKSQDYRHG